MNPPSRNSPAPEKIPIRSKLGWGAGGIADCLLSYGTTSLVMPIYNLGYGVSAFWLGVALCVPRLMDAFTDPIIGNYSDNLRTRWGRRRPLILLGAISSALIFPLIWLPPFHDKRLILGYFGVMMLLSTLAMTIFSIPYTAMGYEFTSDYDEKTNILSWRFYISILAGFLVQWLYALVLLPAFGGTEALGIRYVGPLIALICLASAASPALFCKERIRSKPQPKVRLSDGLRTATSNGPFVILMAAYLILITSQWTTGSLGLYINIFYVFEGNRAAAVGFSGIFGTTLIAAAIGSMALSNWISRIAGKKTAILIGLGLAFLGNLGFAFTIQPHRPYLQLINAVVIGLGLQGCWLMVSSMTADICDASELRTGLREEGIYGAACAFIYKIAMAGTAVTSGAIIKFAGYVEGVAPGLDVTHRMKWLLISVQCIGLGGALLILLFYPLTRKKMESIQAELALKNEREAMGESQAGAATMTS